MSHKIWVISNYTFKLIVEHHNINRSIWIRSSCGFSFWSINGWSHCFYRQHPNHNPLQWRYVSILLAGFPGRAFKIRVWRSGIKNYLVYYEALSFFITASVIILIGFASYINLYGLCDTKQKISEYDNLDEDVNNNTINTNENQVNKYFTDLYP